MLIPITNSVKMKTLLKDLLMFGSPCIPQSFCPSLSLTSLHLEHNYIQSKTTGHELIPYLPPSPRKVISSHSESRFKSTATSAPLCQVSFDLIVTLQGLGVLAA